MDNSIKMDDLEENPLFSETSMSNKELTKSEVSNLNGFQKTYAAPSYLIKAEKSVGSVFGGFARKVSQEVPHQGGTQKPVVKCGDITPISRVR